MSQRAVITRKSLFADGLTGAQKSIATFRNGIIGSYVFFKCHVTDTSNPKITEIAMISLTEHDLMDCGSGDGVEQLKTRYGDTLVLAFDPDEEIHVQDSVNSDLTLNALKNGKKTPFSRNSVTLIDKFLKMQTSPVCLISHAGNYLDFRFLKTAVNGLGMNLLDGNLLCLDTIDMFTKLDSDKDNACLLDSRRYSLDNVYRRSFGALPCCVQYDAKSLVIQLIQVYQNALHNVLDFPRLKNFNSMGIPISKPSSSQSSPHLESPMKKRLLDVGGVSDSQGSNLSCDSYYSSFSSQPAMTEGYEGSIETFVFIDFETTGLDTSTDNIVEICACAVNAQDLNYFGKPADKIEINEIIPRLIDQITITVLPICEIPPVVSKIHGLYREELALRRKDCFTIDTARLLENFLEHLAEPVCLVAHNGFRFDFPMLFSHLQRTKTKHPIWNKIFCSDTLPIMQKQYPGKSHRLGNMFDTLAGRTMGSISQIHSAEGDIIRLIVIAKLQENMIELLEMEKKLFTVLMKEHTGARMVSQNSG